MSKLKINYVLDRVLAQLKMTLEWECMQCRNTNIKCDKSCWNSHNKSVQNPWSLVRTNKYCQNYCHTNLTFSWKIAGNKDASSHFGSLTTNTEVEKNPKDKKPLLCFFCLIHTPLYIDDRVKFFTWLHCMIS